MAASSLKFHHRGGPDTAAPNTAIQALIGGATKFTAGQFVLSSTSYATGGLAADLTQGIGQITSVLLSATGGYVAEYDATNKKIKLYSAGTEVANSTSLTLTVSFLVIGTL